MKRAGATFLLLLGIFGAVFAYFAIKDFSFVKEQSIIPNMLNRWHMLRAFLACLGWVPAFQAAGILVAFGLFKDGEDNRATSFFKASSNMLSVVLVLSLAYGFLYAYAAPNARKEARRMLNASATFESELSGAKKDIDAGLWESANAKLKVCEIIDRDDRRFIELKGVYDRRPAPETAEGEGGQGKGGSENKQDLSANEYYLKALEAQKKGDLYTAHSLATKAFRIDANRTDAQRLAAQLWNEISTMAESPKEKELQKIATAKSEAYRTLAAGNPVEAYRLFLELRKLAPDDADIEEYLKQSLEEARKISFFKDEVTRLSRYPSAGKIFFRVKADERTDLFIACDSVYFGVEQAYLAGLEYLSVSLGKPVLKAVAPYAKLQGDRLLIACYDRDNPQNAFLPSFPVKDVKLTFTNYLTIPFGLKELRIAAIAAGSPAEASIIELNSIYREAAKIGIDGMPFIKEGLMRIQACIAFLLVSLLCVYLGYRFRHRGEKRQLAGALLSFPISVFIAGIALEAWAWFNGTLISILLRNMPALSVTFFIVIQAIALALAFIVLAGYRDAPSD